jgi:predicted PolB exonuclease-like 3'-5' exonuclease
MAWQLAHATLVLDIETVLDPELPIAQAGETERLPAPAHHQVVAIGALWIDSQRTPRRLAIVGKDQHERGILTQFAELLEQRRPTLVTYNGRSFDLPVIAMRCLRHGIPLSHYYQTRDVRYRFSPEGHLDLMDFIADFGAAKVSKLDIIAKLCGMPGKVGVDGKDVGPLVHAGRIQEVRDYCLCDVVQTAAVYFRVELLRGQLSRDEYLGSMGALVDMVKSDERLRPVAEGMNETRLLLADAPTEPPVGP